MIKKELYALYSSLQALQGAGGARFAYAISKNKKFIQEELELVEKSLIQSDEYKAYEAKRIELCKKHAEKDVNGEAKMTNNTFDIIDRKKFDKELKVLQDEYKDTLEEHLKKVEEYNKLLDMDTEITFFKIKLEILPDTYEEEIEDPKTKVKTRSTRPIGKLLDPVLFLIEE